MTDVITILLLSVVAVSWSRFNKHLTKDHFSPLGLLLIFWVVPFGLSLTKLSSLQTGMASESLAIALAATLTMTAVCVVTAYMVSATSLPVVSELSRSSLTKSVAIWGAALLMTAAAVVICILEFRGGIPIVEYGMQTATDANLHRFGKDSRWQLLGHGIFVAGMVFFYRGLISDCRSMRFLLLAMSFLPFAYGAAKASKSDIFLPLLTYCAIYYYHRRSLGQKAWSFGGALLVSILLLGMTLVSSLRLWGISGGENLSYGAITGFKLEEVLPFPINDIVSTIYGYTALNFQNFSNYVEHASSSGGGLGISFFRPFLSLLMEGDVADSLMPPRVQWNYISEAATVGTMLRELYMEGGAVLCIIGPTIYAVLVNAVYLHFRRGRSLQCMFIYALAMFPWSWMFFQNAFSVLQYYVDAVYIFLIATMAAMSKLLGSAQKSVSV